MTQDPLRARFERVDTNRDGKINEAELGALLHDLAVGFSDAQIHAAFAAIDVNGSGQIELEEFRAWWEGPAQARTEL